MPESEVVRVICDRIGSLIVALDEDLRSLGPVPSTLAAFESMGETNRVGSRALLKTVEQLEDQMMRLFRTILQLQDIDTRDLYARDIANRMEALEIVADAEAWIAVVKLRNRLVHDYPVTSEARFGKLAEATIAGGILRATAKRAFQYIHKKDWLA